jgi:hypothetical protein
MTDTNHNGWQDHEVADRNDDGTFDTVMYPDPTTNPLPVH